MVRAPRSDVAGGIYHSLNRGNTRHVSFASRRTLKHLNVLLPRHLLVAEAPSSISDLLESNSMCYLFGISRKHCLDDGLIFGW